ncbi:hypothetical protein CBS101457_000292 [Exobasidium rhododendri]|nr:hypothetical protein CBS101457_000292 [Exobasidium rhododendri]
MSSPATSSTTARNETGTSSSSALDRKGSPAKVNSGRVPSGHRSAASRMPRVLNPVPVWARQEQPSPPSSPKRNKETGSSTQSASKTMPKAPKAAFFQPSAPDTVRGQGHEERRYSSSSTTSSKEANGTNRFWSFTIPSRMRGARAASRNDTLKHNDQAADSSSVEGDDIDPDRRPSMTQHFTSSLGEAFSGMAMGRRRKASSSSERGDNEKIARHSGTEHDEVEQGDAELHSEWSPERASSSHPRANSSQGKARREMNVDTSFFRHQPLTPGWESPWRAEARGGNSIEFGKYRFNNYGEGGYFPRSDTNRSNGSRNGKTLGRNGMTTIHKKEKKRATSMLSTEWWKQFLLYNPFVPLLFRIVNIAFATATLAIAIRLHLLLKREGAEVAVGSSPIVAIIFSPFTLIHVAYQIWLEYFGRPIGLWQVGSKLFYTLIEVVFICLWSAELALSFDNYFTSTLVCTPTNSPYANETNGSIPGGEQSLNDPSAKGEICNLQSALIGLVFVSLLAYVIVLFVSLNRIFVRVTRR